jgi:hypothetical protein
MNGGLLREPGLRQKPTGSGDEDSEWRDAAPQITSSNTRTSGFMLWRKKPNMKRSGPGANTARQLVDKELSAGAEMNAYAAGGLTPVQS